MESTLLDEALVLIERAESLMEKTEEAVSAVEPEGRTLYTIQVILETQTLTQLAIAKTLAAIAERCTMQSHDTHDAAPAAPDALCSLCGGPTGIEPGLAEWHLCEDCEGTQGAEAAGFTHHR